jgi:hypothetical protein
VDRVSCDRHRVDLGVYVLGALDGPERAELEAHLASCPECRDELASLAPLPGLMTRVDPDSLVTPAPAPPGLADRILGEIRRRRRQRRRWSVAAAGALAAAGVGLVIALGVGGSPQLPDLTRTVANSREHAWGRLALTARPWGTSVQVALWGVRPGTRCEILVADRTGGWEVAGSWRVDYEGDASVAGATAVPLADVGDVVVRTMAGKPILRFQA